MNKLLETCPHMLSFDVDTKELVREDETANPVVQYLGPTSSFWGDSDARRQDSPRERTQWNWTAGVEFRTRIDLDEYLFPLSKENVIHPDKTDYPNVPSYTIELASDEAETPPLSDTSVGSKLDITFNIVISRRH